MKDKVLFSELSADAEIGAEFVNKKIIIDREVEGYKFSGCSLHYNPDATQVNFVFRSCKLRKCRLIAMKEGFELLPVTIARFEDCFVEDINYDVASIYFFTISKPKNSPTHLIDPTHFNVRELELRNMNQTEPSKLELSLGNLRSSLRIAKSNLDFITINNFKADHLILVEIKFSEIVINPLLNFNLNMGDCSGDRVYVSGCDVENVYLSNNGRTEIEYENGVFGSEFIKVHNTDGYSTLIKRINSPIMFNGNTK